MNFKYVYFIGIEFLLFPLVDRALAKCLSGTAGHEYVNWRSHDLTNTNITSAPDKLFVTWLTAKNVQFKGVHGLN